MRSVYVPAYVFIRGIYFSDVVRTLPVYMFAHASSFIIYTQNCFDWQGTYSFLTRNSMCTYLHPLLERARERIRTSKIWRTGANSDKL